MRVKISAAGSLLAPHIGNITQSMSQCGARTDTSDSSPVMPVHTGDIIRQNPGRHSFFMIYSNIPDSLTAGEEELFQTKYGLIFLLRKLFMVDTICYHYQKLMRKYLTKPPNVHRNIILHDQFPVNPEQCYSMK
jgi:hypothetical protein